MICPPGKSMSVHKKETEKIELLPDLVLPSRKAVDKNRCVSTAATSASKNRIKKDTSSIFRIIERKMIHLERTTKSATFGHDYRHYLLHNVVQKLRCKQLI